MCCIFMSTVGGVTRELFVLTIVKSQTYRDFSLKNLHITVTLLQVVFLGMLGVVLQGSQDGVRHRRRDRQMLALRMKTVFIGNVAQADGFAIDIGIAEGSLNLNSVFIFGDLDKLALLLRLDAISGLVAVAV